MAQLALYQLFFIATGGAIGAALRHILSSSIMTFFPSSFPAGTLIVNLIGSFFLGVAYGLIQNNQLTINGQAFICVGILSAFTTFSTFSLENIQLVTSGKSTTAMINIFVSIMLSMLCVSFGFRISQ